MAQRRTIFGMVQRLEAAPVALGGPSTQGNETTNVYFDSGDTVRISGDDARSGSYRSILKDASDAHVPVFVVLEDTTGTILELHIPLPPDIVTSLSEADAQTLEVELQVSQGRHFLKRSSPDFQRLRDALENARKRETGVMVTETDEREIIDVREARLPFVLETARPEAPDTFLTASAISMGDAEKLFAMVSGKTCDAKRPVAPCITFLFPDDGCYARAHEMCRLVGTNKTGKVWVYGKLVAKTRNHPNCQVEWRYHVAPTVPVKNGSTITSYVLDPSLFRKPVTITTWKGVQGDPGAKTEETDAEPYYRAPNGDVVKDSDYSETNTALATFRLKLKNRSASTDGAPPYAKCPAALAEEEIV
ncbi:protein-glutamine glutaminase family protein [Sinorhizobium meliloti]|uniref:protein-glutamine glutaminase family protein n=1 Tax=Rhizobium meliloti TaxID=382 RepID=UPI00299EF54E|nr:hypothetical protein [Sinorhizobium meliloti]